MIKQLNKKEKVIILKNHYNLENLYNLKNHIIITWMIYQKMKEILKNKSRIT